MQRNATKTVDSLPIDRVRPADIPDVVRLSARIGWDYSEEEMEVVLRSGRFFAHRTPEGKVVSTAALFPYSTLASLGVVMVDPDYRRRGLATRLVSACIEEVPDRPFLLVATEKGSPCTKNWASKRSAPWTSWWPSGIRAVWGKRRIKGPSIPYQKRTSKRSSMWTKRPSAPDGNASCGCESSRLPSEPSSETGRAEPRDSPWACPDRNAWSSAPWSRRTKRRPRS